MTKRIRIALFASLALAAVLTSALVYAQNSDRAKRVGGQLMCMCGCNEILTQCNHVGCTVSASMLKEMDQRVETNSSDDLILQSFVQEFGVKVLATPPAQGFNLLAWGIPGMAFVGGLVLVGFVIHHWLRRPELAPAAGPSVSSAELDRVRRQIDEETEE